MSSSPSVQSSRSSASKCGRGVLQGQQVEGRPTSRRRRGSRRWLSPERCPGRRRCRGAAPKPSAVSGMADGIGPWPRAHSIGAAAIAPHFTGRFAGCCRHRSRDCHEENPPSVRRATNDGHDQPWTRGSTNRKHIVEAIPPMMQAPNSRACCTPAFPGLEGQPHPGSRISPGMRRLPGVGHSRFRRCRHIRAITRETPSRNSSRCPRIADSRV